jgi:hypothetical protein
MYIPLSFMADGETVIGSCNCNNINFGTTATVANYVDFRYQPCNSQQLNTIRYTSNTTDNSICVAELNYTFSGPGTVTYSDIASPCLQSNCQSCDCYEFFYRISVDGPTYIRYVPCNEPSSSAITIGPFATLSTGSFVCSFPWTVIPISGTFDWPGNGPTGVIKQVNSGSCQPIVSGSLQPGDLKGGGMVMYVTGSYPNQSGLIVSTASFATSSALQSRWGFYGTQTNITNQAYGTGASNTQAIRNLTPTTASMAANTITQSAGGFTDWFLPSVTESLYSAQNGITWPNNLVLQYDSLKVQPQLWRNTRGDSLLTSNEVNTGTTANKQQRVYTVPAAFAGYLSSISKNDYNNVFGYRYFTSSLVP